MRILSICFFVFLFSWVGAQKAELSYYLPDVSFDNSITSPQDYLGFQVGEWHVSHDQLVGYMEHLAGQSERLSIETYGYSHEGRPLILITATNIENHRNLTEIKKNHVQLTEASKSAQLDTENMPIVLYQGYSVHGNESSGANAAILLAYYMAAGQGPKVEELLSNAIVLLDPCYNPDGFHRFSSWVNMHKSKHLVSDPNDREYNEVWPGGRTNHYWFDLNRDWLLLTHPESRARIANFHDWKPNILTDHHEMGTNSTFFFQPGVPERTNPNTPQLNQDLTEKIGKFHAAALDKIGSAYYTKESFDDFYYGKGSTYPDIQGSIGILFEQASSRGHYQESINGIVSFPFTIKNQLITSLSTQEAALALRKEILDFQRDFYLDAAKESAKTKVTYVISKKNDYNKAHYMMDVLSQHDIQIYDDGKRNGAFYIPVNQKQSRLIKAIFEEVKKFKVNIFYDVSAWTFPLAFDVDVQEKMNVSVTGMELWRKDKISKLNSVEKSANIVAYAFEWHDWKAGTLLGRLLSKGIAVKSIHEPFTGITSNGEKAFSRGTMVIYDPEKADILRQEADDLKIQIYGLTSGFNSEGVMLGSPSTLKMESVNALMIIGDGVNAYDAGEIWFQMDQRLELPLTKIEAYKIKNTDLKRYNTIIMPDGNYRYLDKKGLENITDWVKQGGNLIAFKRAINKLGSTLVSPEKIPTIDTKYDKENYGNRKEKSAKHVIGGAIFNTKIDMSYPLFYGYEDADLPVFKRGTLALKADNTSLANPMKYTSTPLASGYASQENVDRIKDSAGIIVYGVGSGKVVCSVDNPLFRGYWLAGNKLFDNMLYLTSGIAYNGIQK